MKPEGGGPGKFYPYPQPGGWSEYGQQPGPWWEPWVQALLNAVTFWPYAPTTSPPPEYAEGVPFWMEPQGGPGAVPKWKAPVAHPMEQKMYGYADPFYTHPIKWWQELPPRSVMYRNTPAPEPHPYGTGPGWSQYYPYPYAQGPGW
jgi:hypothetical protein